MTNTPTAKHFLDRLLDRKDAAEIVTEEMKLIYAEAKEAGYDKTVMGIALNYLVKRRKGKSEKADELAQAAKQMVAEFDAFHPPAPARVAKNVPETTTSDTLPQTTDNPQKPKPAFKPWLNNSKEKRTDG